jgi:hypothetical protein
MRFLLGLFGVLLSIVLIFDDSVYLIPALVDTRAIAFLLLVGFYSGLLLTWISFEISKNSAQRAIKKTDEQRFKVILDSFNGLKFHKRIGDFSYFNYGNFSLVYSISKKAFYIFQGDECLATSVNISDTQTFKTLEENINNKFRDQMNDCVDVNGLLYSKNLFPHDYPNDYPNDNSSFMSKYDYAEEPEEDEYIVPEQKQEQFNLDDILDKINLRGMASLSKEELDFLKSQKG